MKDATQDSIGKILSEGQARDAIHIAVAPVVAAVRMSPGDHIGLLPDGTATTADNHIGIVDPFLPTDVRKGQRFFMFLYPNTITSLRHEWTHPAFGTAHQNARIESEMWLRRFAEQNEGEYAGMVAAALSGESYCFGTDITYEDFYENAEFWTHIEAVTGKTISREKRETANFRCAC